MNSALESTLAVGALSLVLAVVLVSGGSGGEGEFSACSGLSSTGKAASSGRSTTGGSSGGGGKYGSSSSAATTVGKLGAERRRSPQAPPRPIGEV
jgi:hypothetical protein